MIHNELLSEIGAAGIWFTTISVMLFLVVYTRFAAWWKNPVGRTIVALDVALLLLLIPDTIKLALGRQLPFFLSAAWGWIIVGDIFFIGLIALSRVWVWRKIWKAGKSSRANDH